METLALMRLNYMYYSIKEFEKGKSLKNYILKVVDTVKDKSSKSIMLGSLGEYYLDHSEYQNFITYKLKAIDLLLEDIKLDELKKNNIGVSYLQIADAYNDMHQFSKAIEYCKYASPYLNKSDGLAFLNNTYIEAFTNLGNIHEAKKYYNNVYQLAKIYTNLEINISYANRNMAEYYLAKNSLQTADNYANTAILFAKKSKDEEIEMEANVVKGKILFAEKKFPQAISQLQLALKSAYNFDKRSFVDINEKLSESYAMQKNWEKAFFYKNIYAKTNDSLLIQSGNQNIANTEGKYQNRVKQVKISELSAQNTIKNLKIKNNERQKLFFILGLVFLGIIGSLLYYQSRNRKITNNKLQILNVELDKANKIKARFFSIINHDLRSPVASLLQFLYLKKENPELLDEETKNRLEDKSIKSVENLLVSMEDLLLWSKSQMENFTPKFEKIDVSNVFSDNQKHFESIENIKIIYKNPENLAFLSDFNYLKTIIRNLTSNAIKALEKVENPEIIWQAWKENSKIFLSIKDNGTSAKERNFKALYDDLEVTGLNSGLGLHLIRDLAKSINSIIKVEIIEGKSTEIKLEFKA